ncbi:MAG: hypothetical protein EP319_04815 [Deltaproteobacteria bacterium]|nr:MAG: hypothetical protein EP319_04815 [Deltaproteobacteria bacterium]
MKIFAQFLVIFFLSTNVHASFSGEVIFLKGNATYRGKKIVKGEKLEGTGVLKTGEKGIVRIKLATGLYTIGPLSETQLSWKNSVEQFKLLNGTIRWFSKKIQDSNKRTPIFGSTAASIGIRGTDFLMITNSLLGESEVVVFDGKILFQNNKNKNDSKEILKNQWGGVGGRYGHTIGDIINLSSQQIIGLSKLLPKE